MHTSIHLYMQQYDDTHSRTSRGHSFCPRSCCCCRRWRRWLCALAHLRRQLRGHSLPCSSPPTSPPSTSGGRPPPQQSGDMQITLWWRRRWGMGRSSRKHARHPRCMGSGAVGGARWARCLWRMRPGTQFTYFTGTKVQILTQKALPGFG